jgi:hypothetical protein
MSKKTISTAEHSKHGPRRGTTTYSGDREPEKFPKQIDSPDEGQSLKALGKSVKAAKREQPSRKNVAHHGPTSIEVKK